MAGRRKYHLHHRRPDVAKLERIRKKRDESMTQFARQLGISFSGYHDFIRGRRKPRRTILRLAEFLERYDLPLAKSPTR